MRFVALGDDCYVCVSHRLNQDGYFRKRWANDLEMFHRTMWKHHHGNIPKDYEVDHICNNRACCNITHLRCIPGSDHAIHTNRTRYSDRHEDAKAFWLLHNTDYKKLGPIFGVSIQTALVWIKKWSVASHTQGATTHG